MIKLHLHKILEEKGKSMYWIAKESGVRPNTISQWVNDPIVEDDDKKVKQISIDTLEKLCSTLDCSISDLIEYVPNKKEDEL